ncbi:MAG: hypothetical protein Kow0042_03290 [Calditrichia bacterium]
MRFRPGTLFLVLILFLMAHAQSGADSSMASPATNPTQSLNMGWLLFKTILILLLIIALIFVLVYLMKRFVFAAQGRNRESNWIQVLGQVQIQPKKFLALVKVIDRVVLVGLTESSVQALAEFDDLNKIQPYLDSMKKSANHWSENRFLGIFKKNLGS